MLDTEATTILAEIARLEAEVLADTRPARKRTFAEDIEYREAIAYGAPWSHFTLRAPDDAALMRLIRRLHALEGAGLVVCYRPVSDRVRRVKLTEAGRLAASK